MLAFLPLTPSPSDEDVRLDVRIGSGPRHGYVMTEGEFLIGSASGCDIRLASSQFPPVICQFTLSEHGLKVRKLSPIISVELNEKQLSGSAPVAVQDGDIVQAGPVEILIHCSQPQYPRPKLLTLDEPEVPLTPAHEGNLSDRTEFERMKAELAEQTRELEEERAIWYRRKMEMEQELRATPDAAELRSRENALSARERELQHEYDRRFRAFEDEMARRRVELESELKARRQQIEEELHKKHDRIEEEIGAKRIQLEADIRESEPRLVELKLIEERVAKAQAEFAAREESLRALHEEMKRDREVIEDERKWQLARMKELDSTLLERHAELTRRESHLREEMELFQKERDQHKEDLLRWNRTQAQWSQTQAMLEGRTAELNERQELLLQTSQEWEETLKLAESEQVRIRTESERLEAKHKELDLIAAEQTERSARLDSQAASLAQLRSQLARQQEQIQSESVKLAEDRAKLDGLRRDLEQRLNDAEQLRAEVGAARDVSLEEIQTATERNALLASQIEELRATEERVREREIELDARSGEFAEQVALLKSRITQTIELQQRLEHDREAIRAREATLSESDQARLEFQEQLRKRSDELTKRSREMEDLRIKMAEEQAILSRLREQLESERSRGSREIDSQRDELARREKELETRTEALTEREATLERQIARFQEASEALANERESLRTAQTQFAEEQTRVLQLHQSELQGSEELQSRIAAQFAELQAQAPELDRQAVTAMERLMATRDVIRGQLAELHEFAKSTRHELDSERSRLRVEEDQIRQRAQELETARSEHRLAVTGFRQQLLDWQSKIGELRNQFHSAQNQIELRGTNVGSAERDIEHLREELIRQTQEVERERRLASEKRTEMERHLADMREWYRRKLRELAAGKGVDEADMPVWKPPASNDAKPPEHNPEIQFEDTEPGDQQLGELLVSRGLIDQSTLSALTEEAKKQKRALRQILLASGALTLYQLALIEAGTMDGLMLGRLRVVDRIRVTSKESVYRVFDPTRPGGPTRGIYILRHLSEQEIQDAVHPDEFRQRFGLAVQSPHPHLANSLEVLEIQGRPAVLQEWVIGLSSVDWPPVAATPGVWLRLVSGAAQALHHAHRIGLTHGRLLAESFVLPADGQLKILGMGEPSWLAGGAVTGEPTPAGDLRTLGRIAFAWSQLSSRRRGNRSQPFPAELTSIIRRLEIGAEPAMGDVVAIDRPFHDAGELIRELAQLAEQFPCPSDAWNKFVRFAAENAPESTSQLRAAG